MNETVKTILIQLIAFLVPKKTVDSALSAMNKAVADLEKVREAEREKARKQELKANKAMQARIDAEAEAERAANVASKLRALVA